MAKGMKWITGLTAFLVIMQRFNRPRLVAVMKKRNLLINKKVSAIMEL